MDGYVDRAIRLAGDLDSLAAIRAGLRDRIAHSVLCDGAYFARHMESTLRMLWQRWYNTH